MKNCTNKDLQDPINHDGAVTHLEPDILECEENGTLRSITIKKASGISDELFQILKDGAVKVLHAICQQIWKTQQWPQNWKRSVFIPIPKKGKAKECSNYHTIALISHASRVWSQNFGAQNSPSWASIICEPWTSRCSWCIWKRQRNQGSNCQYPLDHCKSKRVRKKHLTLLYWLCKIFWLCGSQQTGKFFKRLECQTTLSTSQEICMQVKKQQLEPDMEQQTGSRSGKE